jgi:hypothetical protein
VFGVDRYFSLRRVLGDVEAVLLLWFVAGGVLAAAATVESALRGRRMLLPLLSLGLHGCGVVLAVGVFFWVDALTRAHGGPR